MDTDEAIETAWSLLDRLQRAVDDEDFEVLSDLFDDNAVLVGTTAHSRGRQEVNSYLSAVLDQAGALRWEWHDVVLSHDSPGVLGFAGFGEVVVSEADREDRAPFRLTALAAKEAGGWKLQQFHGSIPSDF